MAVDLPERLKEEVLAVQKDLSGLDTKLVEKENLHFTLKFLGEIDDSTIRLVEESVSDIRMKPFNVTLKGLGFFPNNNFMRVAWVGSPSEKFIEFHNTVNNVLAHVFSKEKPIPHLTLARVRSQKYVKNIQKLGEKYKDQEFGSFEVKNMKLKKSVLARNGPVYEDLKVFDLYDN